MAVLPRSRSEFKAAGRELAIASCDRIGPLISAFAAENGPEETGAFVDMQTSEQCRAVDEIAEHYLRSGAPLVLVQHFRAAFGHAARRRLREHILAGWPVASTA